MSDVENLKARIAYHKSEVGRLRRLRDNPEPQQRELERLRAAIKNMTAQASQIEVELSEANRLINAHLDDYERLDEELTQLIHGKDLAKLAAIKAKLDQTMDEMRAAGLDPEELLKTLSQKAECA